MLEPLFNKVACLKNCNFIKKRLQHRCFLANNAKFLRTPILKKFCERLLLYCQGKMIITQGLQAGNKITAIKIDGIADGYMVPLIKMPLHHFGRMERFSSLPFILPRSIK